VLRESTGVIGSVRFNITEKEVIMEALYVQPEYRGRGISHQLLDWCHLVDFLDKEILCFVQQDKEDWLFKLYEKHGFIRSGEEDGYTCMIKKMNSYEKD
jgi:GNAT superfamily N-acetyltransferase